MMSKYKVRFESKLPVKVDAEEVIIKEGAVAFYKDREPAELSSSKELVVAFNEWRKVERID